MTFGINSNRSNSVCAQSGQALIELALFGSALILVLGTLISYGMNANIEQEAHMRAIRQGMWSAARANYHSPNTPDNFNTPDNETYVYIDGNHFVPDPSNPFALGTLTSGTGFGSSPTRHFRIGRSAGLNEGNELSRIVYEVGGVIVNDGKNLDSIVDCESAVVLNNAPAGFNIRGCTIAGFRNVFNVWGWKKEDDGRVVNNRDTMQPIDKYDFIYGVTNTRRFGPTVCNAADNCRSNLQITDTNEGEIVSRESASSTCRLILDQAFCQRECIKPKKNPDKPDAIQHCQKLCEQLIEVPPYCSSSTLSYLSPDFLNLFAGIQNMGIQPDVRHLRGTDTTQTNSEDASSMVNISTVNHWSESAVRSFVYRFKHGNMFSEMGVQKRITIPMGSRNIEGRSTEWYTPKD